MEGFFLLAKVYDVGRIRRRTLNRSAHGDSNLSFAVLSGGELYCIGYEVNQYCEMLAQAFVEYRNSYLASCD